ncbi:hypothetical protein [Aeromonas hydrophila]|uniref:Uncharacterized protein n=1 Tax=Aeromonas hydrophila TaxID=644 RepID=A0ABD7G953_AERHY|nr:hypothetical protein [Aeromonas hydrophila]MBC8669867.1 hypothetical protein [Aeromonas hydrophila]MBC8687483.1 hypothetical protein [Aeromonas hydrophila]RCF50291.1 hypothetical protein C6C11_08595 [Aeromonas hydrophila]
MGTNQDSVEIQFQIKSLIAELGWTQNKLAEILYIELNDIDNEDEIERFQERLKKELQRSTTKAEKLKTYLDIIVRHRDTKKIDVVFNKHIPLGFISSTLSQAMGDISKEIDKTYKKFKKR